MKTKHGHDTESCCCEDCHEALNIRVAELETTLRQANEETKLYPEHEGRYAHLLR